MAFQSRVAPGSPEFATNAAAIRALVQRLRALEARAEAASEASAARFEARGQITPRERLARLLDPGMPFLRLHSLAGYQVDTAEEEASIPGSSLIAGIGFVAGTRVMVWVDDSGIKAGAMGAMSLPVTQSIQAIALRQKLPLVHLVESAGANLMKYEVRHWAEGGRIFANLARASAAGIPSVAVLHGASTAGGAYMIGLSDYVIGVKKRGMAALAGAALVQAATGEAAEDRALGGSEMHAEVTGLVEYLAEDDAHGVALAREVIGRLDWNKSLAPRPARAYAPPIHDPAELPGVIPADPKTPYEAQEIVARIVDGSESTAFKPDYGRTTLCLHAAINGFACGLICNNGPIDPAGATKAAQFIQLSDQAETPLIFLHNTTGYFVGTEYERAGMIKHGSKMIQAVANARVAKIALHVGASYGAGNYGMAGYGFDPDFLFAWPNALTGVMGGAQAAGAMVSVMRQGAERKGAPVDEAALEGQREAIQKVFDRQADAFYTSGRCLDHGVIDPADTRRVLGFCLETIWEARNRRLQPNAFGAARM
ncbi:acyl-CoA carboxylase subunit beta [Pikeienuella piscinae]|uniref:Acyl-CoA carboxylase subunit beta n=1 Tax=Pikeienuella piscinae TaxID=2748098 RepID=A0A7L5BUP5_9RHOB|nr:carboxyl transferase domain-containing protein [Pikeienuella piscinae]QIE54127.1 acyl-CoA carboxylase subunit beta [Pikeienuella piscinae]